MSGSSRRPAAGDPLALARVARLLGPRELVFEDQRLEPPGAGQFAARTEWSAISSGTEKAAFMGAPPLREGRVYPRLVGYCNVATVTTVGPDVTWPAVGDRVLTNQSHRTAFVCGVDAVLAVLGRDLDPQSATLTYIAQLGLVTLQRGNFRPGDRVAVIGLGLLGLCTTMLTGALGGVAIAFGNDNRRLSLARQLGARSAAAVAPEGGLRDDDRRLASSFEVVALTVNAWSAWRAALELAAPFATISVLGFPGRNEGPPGFNPFEPSLFYVKQLTVAAAGLPPAANGAPRDEAATLRRNIASVLSMAEDGRLDLGRLITHRVPWHQLGDMYARLAEGDRDLLGVVLDWSSNPNGEV